MTEAFNTIHHLRNWSRIFHTAFLAVAHTPFPYDLVFPAFALAFQSEMQVTGAMGTPDCLRRKPADSDPDSRVSANVMGKISGHDVR
jgi:hypothetical protein